MSSEPIMPAGEVSNRVRAVEAYRLLPGSAMVQRRHDPALRRMWMDVRDVVDLKGMRDRAITARARAMEAREAAGSPSESAPDAPPVAGVLAASAAVTASEAVSDPIPTDRSDIVVLSSDTAAALSSRTDGLPPVPLAFGMPAETSRPSGDDSTGRRTFWRVTALLGILIVFEWLLLTWLTRGG